MKSEIKATIEKYNMLKSGDKVLVALSGGADSVCLLHILNALADEYDLTIFAAHVNHMLRGAESDCDEQFAVELCLQLGVSLYIKRQNAAEFADSEKIGLEEAGRIIRYNYFKELKEKLKANKIATAHNKNDQAETMVMRFLRGTGLSGLGGIKPIREDGIIRPLIETKRERILEYLRENEIIYRYDESNADRAFLRNRVRHELIPVLNDYNPNLIDTLSNISELLRNDGDFIDAIAKNQAKEIGKFKNNELEIDVKKLLNLHRALASRVLRQLIGKVFCAYKDVEYSHIDDIIDFCRNKSSGKELDISNNLRCTLSYDSLIIFDKSKDKKHDFSYFLNIGKSVYIAETGDEYSLFIANLGSVVSADNKLVFDYKNNIQGIILRSRKNGDKYTPLGAGGTQKLKDIFIDNKIPKRRRNSLVVMEAVGEILWVEGYRINEKYKINKDTKKVLVVTINTNLHLKY